MENIVAIAKVIDVGGESNNQLLHGVPLGENNVRVSVIRAIEGEGLDFNRGRCGWELCCLA